MAGFRVPGPAGLQAVDLPIDSGTLQRQATPLPGTLGGPGASAAVVRAGWGPAAVHGPARGAHPPPRQAARPSAPGRIPVLRLGQQGAEVRKLQRLLNLKPLGRGSAPPLQEDGQFGPATEAAVRRCQRSSGLSADGVAGKDTWRVLVAAPAEPSAPPAPARRAPVALAAAATAQDVLAWTTQRKFEALAQRTVDRLPGQAKQALLQAITPTAIATSLALWAASHLVGAGEVIDLAFLAVGLVMMGTAVFSVLDDLGQALALAHNADSQADIDQAAELLAQVVIAVGVTALVALLAKLRTARRGAGGGKSAAAAEEAAAKPAGAGAGGNPAPDKQPSATSQSATSQPSTKTSTQPADKAGSLCEKAGCPISMVTGEEMLALDDFVWDGPLPLTWRRFYRSGLCHRAGELGQGWLSPLDEWLELGERITWCNADGQRIDLPRPGAGPGDLSLNLPEQVQLRACPEGFVLRPAQGPERVFAGATGGGRLLRWQQAGGLLAIHLLRDDAGLVSGLQASTGRGLLIERQAGTGRVLAIHPARYDTAGLVASGEPLVRYKHDDAGRLVAAQDRLGQGEQYAYFDDHLLQRRTLASGFSFHFDWQRVADGPARCVHNWGDGGIYDTRFEWPGAGLSRVIDSRGGITEYQHNAQAQLLRKRSPEGRETRYRYNHQNLLVAIIHPSGHSTRLQHDAAGRVVRITDALGQVQQLQYGEHGQAELLIDALHQRWQRRFDAQGRLVEQRDPDGAITRHAYNAQGLLAQVTDAVGRQRRLLWDAQQRLVGDIGFDGLRRHFQHDADDRIVRITTQDQLTTTVERDATGRITAVVPPDGRRVQLAYDAAGRLTRYTDAAGHTTSYAYAHGLSQPSSKTDGLGRTTHYAYDTERNLTGLRNPLGDHYQLQWDKDELLVAETGFDGREQRYEHDANGALRARLEAAAAADSDAATVHWQRTEYERDALGQLLCQRAPDGNERHFSYDAAGRLLQARNAHSTVQWQRDAVGRVLQETQNGQTVASTFDPLGRRTRLQTPDGVQIDFHHQPQGRLSAITVDGQPLSSHRYDELGREVLRRQGALETHQRFDAVGRLLQQRTTRLGQAPDDERTAPLLQRRYDYDAAGRLSQLHDFHTGTRHYLYDPADQLTAVAGLRPEQFVHDPAGNLMDEGGAAPGVMDEHASATQGQTTTRRGDRLHFQGDRHYDYDSAGNVVKMRRGTGGRLRSIYTYNTEHQLVQADTPQGRVQFAYDALGRRIRKTTDSTDTRFIYSGVNLLMEISTPPVPEAPTHHQRLYLFEPDSFRPLALIDGSGPITSRRICHYQLDQLGTPQELTDAQGQIVWRARLRAHGALALAEEQAVPNPLRFQGQYHDSETGLHYNLHRYYDPDAGRFIQQDPIGLAGGDNLYRYAPNPVNWVDPLGLTGKDCYSKPSLLDAKAEGHILNGDATGGGHRPGTVLPGKSEFPAGWSDAKIKGEISDIATDPSSSRMATRGGRIIATGTRDGIDIKVITEANGRIVTGYPTNVPRNPL